VPARVLDALILVLFLALVFLLGVFPLNDTDFWWHLKTGDLIRETGRIPHVDTYSFGAEGRPWIDLHWLFQVAVSAIHGMGGVPAVNLAKCAVTSLALFLLITSKRRDWPLWVMALAWLPALILLGGRMYVRPETLTLFYMACYLAILIRWREHPFLAWLLPLVQLAWTNSQGLFVFGPAFVALALVDAACDRAMWAPERLGWWKTVGLASAFVLVACFVNPYGLEGARYPLKLLETMGNPAFSTIMELQSIPDFIASAGWSNVPLGFQIATFVLGVVSFLLPPLTSVFTGRIASDDSRSTSASPRAKRATATKTTQKRKPSEARGTSLRERRPLPMFRLVLFALFSLLSLKATRNSHQFAAIAGTITAWNLGEWAARFVPGTSSRAARLSPRWLTVGILIALLAFVATGSLYAWQGEGRTVGLGVKPLWFPDAAVRAAGAPGMPVRCVAIHNGHAAYYEYVHAPDRKVYLDARLEVIGPALYQQYQSLERALSRDDADWESRLLAMRGPDGLPPAVIVDMVHGEAASIAATLLAAGSWRCVHFDPVAALFVHASVPASRDRVDFLARHFGTPGGSESSAEFAAPESALAEAKALRNVASALISRGRVRAAEPLLLRGVGLARRLAIDEPRRGEAWKYLGQLLMLREPMAESIARFRQAWDPAVDLNAVQSIYALEQASRLAPGDFTTEQSLFGLASARGLRALAVKHLESLLALRPINRGQREMQRELDPLLPRLQSQLATDPLPGITSRDALESWLARVLDAGDLDHAARGLEQAYPPPARVWPIADRLASWRMHLGQPAAAEALWRDARDVARPGLQQARIGQARMVELRDADARDALHAARRLEPGLFEALYSLAVLERDAGDPDATWEAATAALAIAPSDSAKALSHALINLSEPYRRSATDPR
jgi:tetratricopeptide (TPR) repeat protein